MATVCVSAMPCFGLDEACKSLEWRRHPEMSTAVVAHAKSMDWTGAADSSLKIGPVLKWGLSDYKGLLSWM